MRASTIQAQFRRHLGKRYTEGIWHYLKARGFVEEVLCGAAELDYLLSEAELILDCLPPDEPRTRIPAAPNEGPTPGQERAWALTQLVADLARRDPDVVQFRDGYLGGRLMAWEDVETWLRRQSEDEGPITRDLTLTLPADADLRAWSEMHELVQFVPRATGRQIGVRILDYALPDDRWVRRIAVTAGGTLDALRRLSEALADAYGWVPAQATIYVLTGTTAFIDPIRAKASYSKVRHNMDMAWACRIVLDIDPACTPDEVSAAFQAARRQQGLDRLRPLSAKHLRLAAFACAEHVDRPWADRFALWNREFPEWRYAAQSNFRRDAIRAQYRILYPGRHRGAAPSRTS